MRNRRRRKVLAGHPETLALHCPQRVPDLPPSDWSNSDVDRKIFGAPVTALRQTRPSKSPRPASAATAAKCQLAPSAHRPDGSAPPQTAAALNPQHCGFAPDGAHDARSKGAGKAHPIVGRSIAAAVAAERCASAQQLGCHCALMQMTKDSVAGGSNDRHLCLDVCIHGPRARRGLGLIESRSASLWQS